MIKNGSFSPSAYSADKTRSIYAQYGRLNLRTKIIHNTCAQKLKNRILTLNETTKACLDINNVAKKILYFAAYTCTIPEMAILL